MLCKILRSPFKNAPPEHFFTAFESPTSSERNKNRHRMVSVFLWLPNRDSPACGRSGGAGKPSTGRFSYTRPSNPLRSNRKTKAPPIGGAFLFGCRIGIRTPTNRVRVCRATVTQFGNVPRTHYSIASPGAFVKIFFKKIENFPPDFSARRKNPSRRLQRCINVVK